MKPLIVLLILLVSASAASANRGRVKVLYTGNDTEGSVWTHLNGPAGWSGPLGFASPSAKSADPWIASLALVKPSTYISGFRAWNRTAEILRAMGGPTSGLGILGKPFDYRLVPPEFRPGGRFALAGAAGILGANSLRGPAGDTGGHGFLADAGGNYRNHLGQIVRTFVVGNGPRARQHELYEIYDESTAERLKTNDTSHAIAGLISSPRDTDTDVFTARSDQKIVVAAVPEKPFENYNLILRDDGGRVLGRSNARYGLNHFVLEVPKGARLASEISLGYSHHLLLNSYKHFVVGEKD